MPEQIDQCEWIEFRYVGPSKTGKTQIWHVILKESCFVGGEIKWYGAWRKYAFFPNSNTLYEQQCLRDIANFLEAKTREQRRKVMG